MTYDDVAAIVVTMGCPPEIVPGMKTAEQTTEATSTTVKVRPQAEAGQIQALKLRRGLKECLIPKAGPDVPQLTVLFDTEIESHLPPILVQCVSQVKILLEQCQNVQTLKSWIKFPIVQFPQREEHFDITWGDEGELAIYIHEVGPEPYTLGKWVAVIRKAKEQAAASSSSSS